MNLLDFLVYMLVFDGDIENVRILDVWDVIVVIVYMVCRLIVLIVVFLLI